MTKTYHLLFDPAQVARNIGIDSGFVAPSTSDAKAHNTSDDGLSVFHANEWATRISLARILTTLAVSSTDHVTSDTIVIPVVVVTSVLVDNGDSDPLQDGWQIPVSRLKGTPSGNHTLGSNTGTESRGRQAGSLDGSTQTQGFGQLQDDNIIVHGVGIPGCRLVKADVGDSDIFTLVSVDIASHDISVVNSFVRETVSSTQNGPGIQNGTTTIVTGPILSSTDRDLPWNGVWCILSTNNSVQTSNKVRKIG